MSPREQIEQLLEQGHSKVLRDEIVNYIGDSKVRMKALMHFFFHENWRLNQRASWPVGLIGTEKPNLLSPFVEQMLDNLQTAKHDAVIRNTIRTFQYMEVSEDVEGKLYDICMNYLIDLKQAVAIRCFSMVVLSNIARKHSALQEELVTVVREFYEHGTAGYKSRARKIFKEFDR